VIGFSSISVDVFYLIDKEAKMAPTRVYAIILVELGEIIFDVFDIFNG